MTDISPKYPTLDCNFSQVEEWSTWDLKMQLGHLIAKERDFSTFFYFLYVKVGNFSYLHLASDVNDHTINCFSVLRMGGSCDDRKWPGMRGRPADSPYQLAADDDYNLVWRDGVARKLPG